MHIPHCLVPHPALIHQDSLHYRQTYYIMAQHVHVLITQLYLFFRSKSQYRASNSGDREEARGPWVIALLLTNLPQACVHVYTLMYAVSTCMCR